MSLLEELEEPPASSLRPAARSSSDGPFAASGTVGTIVVLDWLGIEHDDKHATCPGCGEPGALICENGGLKCLHDRCAGVGPANHPGFRSNADIVAAVENIQPIEAAKRICERFGLGAQSRSTPSAPLDDTGAEEPRLERLADVLPDALALAQRRQSGEEQPVPTPWPDYNEALGGGLWPGMHVEVAGTGKGKTQFELQIGLHAASLGIPVAYVGLELDKEQIGLRLLGERAGVSWSRLYTGRCSAQHLDRVAACMEQLSGLPVFVEEGPPGGWPASRIDALAGAMRNAHPTGPIVIIVDFLQLLGEEPCPDRRVDLRERIGRAAYAARYVAREHGAVVRLVSSIARDKYNTAALLKSAGIGSATMPGFVKPRRVLLNPDALVGLGKESGEIEFAADSVTVLAKWPTPLDNGEAAYVVAVPKVRYGAPTWGAMHSPGWHFEELPEIHGINDLPEADLGGRGRPKVKTDDFEQRILDVLSRGPVSSQNKMEIAVGGTNTKVRKALKRLVESGAVVRTAVGYALASDASETEGSATQ